MTENQPDQLLEFVQRLSSDGSGTLSATTQLFKDRVLDSMNILDLIGFVEKKLGRKLKSEEITMQNFGSVEKIEQSFFQP